MEEKLIIKGNNKLHGEVCISGAKNSAVGIIPAVILSDSGCIIKNLPDIEDVKYLKELLLQSGAKVEEGNPGEMKIVSKGMRNYKADFETAKKMRASYYFIGAFLSKFGRAEVPFPGGCDIGIRPIDQHIKGFEALGAKIKVEHGVIKARAAELVGAPIYLDVVSVGATINIILAACKAKGITIIENAAKEPYIVDIANLLNAMGANIKGAGTDVIKIKGVEHLGSCEHTIIPDMMEAGTYMIASAATHGDVLIKNVIPTHLESVSAKLREMNIEIDEYEDSIRVRGEARPKAVNIKTIPYPGFPTDLQQPMSVLLSIAEGTGIITESIWEGRFKHVDELKRMGANIKVEGRVAIIEGRHKLSGSPVHVTDLRAGAAMVIAGLAADGETEISNLKHIDRGYENLVGKLKKIGADISRVEK
ncbi:MAG TPA: UDP-N-acetylglucosamine 1-carboxyvinyltransferase [Bacillota bacterium]|nr:UDP-N-acetylglucosamine 1-carboxyvinyltransferase [Bacillota bacterium]HOR85707.1 UDP-N-acetylglucosamine 1-carboxyvinyltransferase [Bacillota bacterium]HPL54305.1 UDP-N-acetylglucosamine 1-carboxyvinyltransferase [Bacillota bacterium]